MNLETNEGKRTIKISSLENDFESREEISLKVLEALSNYNDQVIELRKLLYTEIELSQYVCFEDVPGNSDAEYLKMGKFPICLENDYKDISKEIEEIKSKIDIILSIDGLQHDIFRFLLERLDRLPLAKDRLTIVLECMTALKNSGVVSHVDKMWNIFLLRLYSKVLLGEEDSELDGIYQYTNEEHYREIIRKVYNKLDKYLRELQNNNSQNILMLYSVQELNTKDFYGNGAVSKLYDTLFSNIDLRARYIDTNGNNGSSNDNRDSGKKCFAVMYNKNTGEKFAAISGLFDASRYIYQGVTSQKTICKRKRLEKEYISLVQLLQKLLGKSFKVIDSDKDVKYYLKNKGKMRTITAYQFINSVLPFNKVPGRRMFSCCERKLSTMLKDGDTHEIYVKFKPCKLCERMINEENIKGTQTIICYYWKVLPDLQKRDISLFDQAARNTGII